MKEWINESLGRDQDHGLPERQGYGTKNFNLTYPGERESWRLDQHGQAIHGGGPEWRPAEVLSVWQDRRGHLLVSGEGSLQWIENHTQSFLMCGNISNQKLKLDSFVLYVSPVVCPLTHVICPLSLVTRPPIYAASAAMKFPDCLLM